MKPHAIFHTDNERLAQELGITSANTMFKDFQNVNYQGFVFSWDETFGELVAKMCSGSLFMYYPEKPENYESLQAIASEAALIEANNLVKSAKGKLPVAKMNKEEIIKLSKHFFFRFYHTLEHDFELAYAQENPNAEDLEWRVAFTKLHTPEYVLNKAFEKLDAILATKGLNDKDADIVRRDVRLYLIELYSDN